MFGGPKRHRSAMLRWSRTHIPQLLRTPYIGSSRRKPRHSRVSHPCTFGGGSAASATNLAVKCATHSGIHVVERVALGWRWAPWWLPPKMDVSDGARDTNGTCRLLPWEVFYARIHLQNARR